MNAGNVSAGNVLSQKKETKSVFPKLFYTLSSKYTDIPYESN